MKIQPRFIIEDDDLDLLWRFTAYIKQVVNYARLEYLRKSKKQIQEIPLSQAPPETLSYEVSTSVINDEFDFEEEKLAQAFTKLPLLRQQILISLFVEGLSAQETADKFNCSVDYVYLQKHRTLKKLRDQLMDEGGDRNGK
jgi:RNA polymerase sigma factor (sigma-70 family)